MNYTTFDIYKTKTLNYNKGVQGHFLYYPYNSWSRDLNYHDFKTFDIAPIVSTQTTKSLKKQLEDCFEI